MTSRAGRPQRDLVPPSRLNAFQLHYLDRVIPEFQKGSSSFTAYDESLEAAYDWLRNFEDALKNNADAALLAKTPGKATAKKTKAAVKLQPVSRPPAFALPAARQNVPFKAKPVAIAASANAASKASKPVAPTVLSSPVVVVLDTPVPGPEDRVRASSFGEDQTDDDDRVKISFGGKSRPASLFSQLSLASTAATSASEWEAAHDQEAGTRRKSNVDVVKDPDEGMPADDASPVVTPEDRLSVVEEVVTPPVTSEAVSSPPAAAPAVDFPAIEAVAAATAPAPKPSAGPAADVASVNAAISPPSSPVIATVESASVTEVVEAQVASTVRLPEATAVEAIVPAVDAASTAPLKPSRTVRSSWLRSALGAETGAPAGPGAGAARKSQGAALIAAAREREKERERELAPAAAAMAAIQTTTAGVKRKSDEFQPVEDTVDVDNTVRSALQRSIKLPKLDERPFPSSSMLPTALNAATTPFKRALLSPSIEAEQPEDGMTRVRKAMEEISARNKGRGMSTVGLGTFGGSILSNQSLVGRLTMPAGQASAGTPTFGSMVKSGLSEDVVTPSPEDAGSKRFEEEPIPTATDASADDARESAEADEIETVIPCSLSSAIPEIVDTFVASVEAPAPPASPEVPERSFEIIDLTQSINSLPPTPDRLSAPSSNWLSAPSPNVDQTNAPSSFGSLMGVLEHATASPSPPPTPPAEAVTAPATQNATASEIFRMTSPPRSAKTVPVDHSTTPMASPTKKRVSADGGDLTLEDLQQSAVVDEEEEVRFLVNAPKDRLAAGVPKMRDADKNMGEELIMDVEPVKQPVPTSSREASLAPSGSKLKQSLNRSVRPESGVRGSTAPSARLAASSSSQGFSRLAADKIAGRKPQVDEVKSLQAASLAAKKERDIQERRAAVSKLTEANRTRAANQKAIDAKAIEEEAKRKKMDEIRQRKANAADVEKRRKEREAQEKEKRDQLAVARAAEEESKKRKTGPTNAIGTQPKRQLSTAGPSSIKVPTGKIATKMGMASSTAAAGKVIPSFSHLPPGPKAGPSQAGPSTIRLVGSSMGPPVRTSDMGKSIVGLKGGQANRVSQAQGAHHLQASRQALQSAVLSKSQSQPSPRGERPGESEAIELADIDSEYSDSDDEDRPRSGKDAPEWAQSPNINTALRSQEMHNPDEIFGRMKPLSMEEIFRARAGKFRARTSSANWTHDGVTPQEEDAYSRRMGWHE